LSALPDSDIRAIAVYFASQNGSATNAGDTTGSVAGAMGSWQLDSQDQPDPGADLYRAACSSCHYNSAAPPSLLRPELAFNSALRSSDPTNLIQVILHGVGVREGIAGTMMPPFAASMSDRQIESLAGYLRGHLTNQPPWTELSKRIAAVRKGDAC
jgi:mono/diheme cytochrome c family protein